MKRIPKLNILLAAVGCASLLAYILACTTSFSPDDSQVLYPAFDKQSGAVSIAVYDRNTGRSETIFTAVAPAGNATNQDLLITRAQWLSDGKHVLIGHALADKEDGLSLVVVPRGVNEPIRHLPVTGLDEPVVALEFPFCVVDSKVLLASEKALSRVDLKTGLSASVQNTNNVWPLSTDGSVVVAACELENDEGMTFGDINPQTLEFKPLLTLTNKLRSGVFPSFSPRDHKLVYVSGDDNDLRLEVLTAGKVEFSRPIGRGDASMKLGPWLDLGPRSDRVFTTYVSGTANTDDAEYGVVEIPLNEQPLRWIPLFRAKAGDKEELLFAQASLSHDGRTWAIATSYLYLQNESLKPEDCALFLVDVGLDKPRITKVPIQPPAQRRELAGF